MATSVGERMPRRSRCLSVLLSGMAIMLLFSPAEAQEKWEFQGAAGVGVPVGDLGDAAGVGPTVGASFGYSLRPSLVLHVGGQVEALPGGDYDAPSQIGRSAPEVTLWHYHAGIEYQLLNETDAGWSLAVRGNVGATTFDSDFRIVRNPVTDELVTDVSGTYFSPSGGVVGNYSLTPQVDLFARGELFAIFADRQETGAFQGLSEGTVQAFDTALSVPVAVGVRHTW